MGYHIHQAQSRFHALIRPGSAPIHFGPDNVVLGNIPCVNRESCEIKEGHRGLVSCVFELPQPAKRHHPDYDNVGSGGTESAAAGPQRGPWGEENSSDRRMQATSAQHCDTEPGSSSAHADGGCTIKTSASELLRELEIIGECDGGLPSFLGQQHRPAYATTFVATGSADGAVRLWKAPAIAHMRQQSGWKCTQTLEAHGGTVTSITGAPGLLVTGSTDRSVKLWRAVEGRRGATLYP